MINSHSMNELSTWHDKHDMKCKKTAINHCQKSGRIGCVSYYFNYEKEIRRGFEHIQALRELLIQDLKALVSNWPVNSRPNLVEQLNQVKMQALEIEEREHVIQRQLTDLSNGGEEALDNKVILTLTEMQTDRDIDLVNDVKVLKEDIEELIFELKEIHDTIPSSEQMISLSTNLNESAAEEDEEVIHLGTTLKMSRKIHLANNFVSRLRGPFKIVIDAPMHVVELCTRGKHASDAVVQAVRKGIVRQNEDAPDQKKSKHLLKPAFTEITSRWTFESKNTDRGFSSASEWMRNPQGQRILVKTQDHPLSAANEWLAYTLGELMGLPVNEVQIAIYKNNLVTLHTDITGQNEKTITYMDLPKQRRKAVLASSTIARMDLFDHILQNVDRNPRNILITIPTTCRFEDENAQSKVYLIDHSASFGMGKLNIISVMASKFHSEHLSVVKFDPKDEGQKFVQYLNKLPAVDRILIRNALNRFAAISNDQFDRCINKVHYLLSVGQRNRIREVLYRQRDIAKYYVTQWAI